MAIKKYHVSKNLYNNAETSWTSGYLDNDGQPVSSTSSHYTTNFTEVSGNTVYTWSGTLSPSSTNANNIYYYDENKNWISKASSLSDNLRIFTTPQNCKYVRFQNNINIVSGADWMLNTGSQPLPFEPYGNTWTEIPYRKYGTETDTLSSLPADVIADGQSATANIIGNMVQTGTPSPSSIIMPDECGNKTANLFDKSTATSLLLYINTGDMIIRTNSDARLSYIPCKPNTTYTVCKDAGSRFTVATTANTPAANESILNYVVNNTAQALTITTPSNASYLAVWYWRTADTITEEQMRDSIMIIEGSTTPSTYIPYGYKIPISSGSVTTNKYLGEVQSTRNIAKYIFDGTEQWQRTANGAYYLASAVTPITDFLHDLSITSVNSHFAAQANVTGSSSVADNKSAFYGGTSVATKEYYIAARSITTLEDFTQYLADQYLAGTPVTVWYVLATPTTGILNEPIRKIGNYADSVSVTGIPTTGTAESFDIGTTLKPSEVDLTYHGWHEHSDTKFTG